MWTSINYPGAILLYSICCAASAAATDLETSKPHRKLAHAPHHGALRIALPGPVLSMSVLRGPTCAAGGGPYPTYAQASCRDHDGVLTAFDPRSPSGARAYGYRAHYGLR